MKKILLTLALTTIACLPFSSAHAYTIDSVNHIATVSPSDGSSGIITALNEVNNRVDKTVRWKVNFTNGIYNLTKGFYIQHLENIDLVGNGSTLQKGSSWSSEYIMYFAYAKNVTIKNFIFRGLTDFLVSNNKCVWGEQGVYLGSTINVTVDHNKFINFGDAALRVTTYDNDPIKGVNSFNNVTTNNMFNNVCQTSTTSNSLDHGGTQNYLFQFNTFDNLHGSVKFATRTPAKDIKVLNNWVRSSTWHGIESDNYDNLTILGNKLENIAQAAITVYTNPRAAQDWACFNNLLIKGNIINNALIGIRFSPQPYADGFTFIPNNVAFKANTVSNIIGSNPGIYIINGKVNGLTITDNTLSSIASKKALGYATGSTNVVVSGNTMDGVAVK